MPLNISSSTDYDPYVKYNAKSGRWYVKEGDTEREVDNPVFVADFANIKTGWFLFLEGQAPDKVIDKELGHKTAPPSESHKRGFSLRLFSKQSFGGVVELSGASMHLNNAITDLYNVYEATDEAKAGKLPVVAFTGTTPSKDKFGTNYKPNFEIKKWVDRPVELDGGESHEPEQAVHVTPQPTPAQSSVSEF